MRLIKWTDKDGYHHLSLVRDDDPDEFAPYGIPVDPPPLDLLDWEAVKRDLHNQLVDREITTWDDVVRTQDGVTNAVRSALVRRVVTLYRQEKRNDDS